MKSVCVSKDELKEEKEFNVIGTKILKRLIKKKHYAVLLLFIEEFLRTANIKIILIIANVKTFYCVSIVLRVRHTST